ncbi:MAG: M20 family metallopeptidase [Clostridiales bacterium]|nr:M20 family metallopeptidase [Clostridiales bacterium]
MIDKKRIRREASKIKESIIGIRRDIHMHPELGMEEKRTSKLVRTYLDNLGIKNKIIANTGVIGTIYGRDPKGPTIGIRADMDALPILEANNVSYASKCSGKMHACGHDAHTAILLGTATVLNSMKDELPGNIRLIFQPAEETTGGAEIMINEGALKDPDVNGVIGLHMEESIKAGCIGIKYGIMNASSNPFEITIKGKSSHGAYPHEGVDAILISAYVLTALQSVVSRETNPLNSVVLTIGTVNGGYAPNVICDKVVLKGILRTMDAGLRKSIPKRIVKITDGITKSMNASFDFDMYEGYPCLINDKGMTDLIIKSAAEQITRENVLMLENPSMGVEDFAYFCYNVPSAFYRLGCRNEKKGIVNSAHSPLFDIDEDSIEIGMITECQAAVNFIFNFASR